MNSFVRNIFPQNRLVRNFLLQNAFRLNARKICSCSESGAGDFPGIEPGFCFLHLIFTLRCKMHFSYSYTVIFSTSLLALRCKTNFFSTLHRNSFKLALCFTVQNKISRPYTVIFSTLLFALRCKTKFSRPYTVILSNSPFALRCKTNFSQPYTVISFASPFHLRCTKSFSHSCTVTLKTSTFLLRCTKPISSHRHFFSAVHHRHPAIQTSSALRTQ